MAKFIEILVPLIPAIAAAIWGYIKYADERDIKIYQENVKELFSSNKDILLSSIATLGFYKDKKKYKKNVIDILINRLYTELDYDLINAIVTELSQISTKNELILISRSLLDINRNFVVQALPINERKKCIESVCEQAEKDYLYQLNKFEDFGEQTVQQQRDYLNNKRRDAQYLNDLHQYKLGWHKQVISDALAMLLLEGNRRNLTKDFSLNLYYNSIHYSQFFNVRLKCLYIEFSEFISSSLLEIFVGTLLVRSSFFGDGSLIRLCTFKTGQLSNVEFIDSKLDNVVFENVSFQDVYFIRTELNHCIFRNVKGLDPLLFYSCVYRGCEFDESFDISLINSVTKQKMLEGLKKSSRSIFGRKLISDALDKENEIQNPVP
ncbi:pentapeptide repeat-containing protein [Tolypothrix sp. FACHB-123]|uniref:pentapeptide repeat-containing protein n=1 Tax=Tolypothrix sp. FACHB-123 TaxID=2692868 RepID=UPI0016836ADD|nr:pentapeptide repeat-containing protein [Tolypothrix sp. FACHB-123]MBD2359458.1 pentapeptide repeat-containing protein [Tolypothrix sp. FACHB-123]